VSDVPPPGVQRMRALAGVPRAVRYFCRFQRRHRLAWMNAARGTILRPGLAPRTQG